MRVPVGILLGVMVGGFLGSPAFSAEAGSAWASAGAPLVATGSFTSPPGAKAVVADMPLSYALLEDNHAGGGIFDEVRLGVLEFWQDNSESVEGIYVTAQVLFDPFVDPFNNWFLNVLLRPRPHIGGTASFDGPDQLFAGLTWTAPIWRNIFLEASFGGTVHNGPLEGAQISLGCHVLFRESLGLGVDVGEHWRLMVGVDHSSHASLCDGENDGLTHLGGYLGYHF